MMEVCVDCVSSAVNGYAGGAMRLELCSALNEGGLTPSIGILTVVKKLVSIPVFCMVRPRSGEDFVYNDSEIEAMIRDIEIFKENGVDGIVLGCLTPKMEIDVNACSKLLESAGTLPVTFHRAFDYVIDPYEGLETLIELGFQRVLTSGQAISVDEGIDVIKELMNRANGRIIVMPGGGITEFNLKKILEETNASEFHGSAKRVVAHNALRLHGSQTSLSSAFGGHVITDLDNVRRLISIAKSLRNT